jgi:hypothetical protein
VVRGDSQKQAEPAVVDYEKYRALRARIAELEANHEATVKALEGELERVKQNAAAWAEDVRRLRDALAETPENIATVTANTACFPHEAGAALAAIRKRAGLEP